MGERGGEWTARIFTGTATNPHGAFERVRKESLLLRGHGFRGRLHSRAQAGFSPLSWTSVSVSYCHQMPYNRPHQNSVAESGSLPFS